MVWPDFRDRCLICGRAGCARRNGFYVRKTANLRIVTFECQNPPPGRHRTFSLLPWPLIPYRQRGVDFLRVLVQTYAGGKATWLQTTTRAEARLNLAVSLMGTLHGWLAMDGLARQKWAVFREQTGDTRDLDDLTLDALGAVCHRFTALTEDFLYGVPSQHRPARHCRSP